MSQQHRGNHAQRVVCMCTVYKLQHMTRATIYASTTPAPAYMDCNTLQHTATHCNTLQHMATHCNTRQQGTLLKDPYLNAYISISYTTSALGGFITNTFGNTLQHTATHVRHTCNTLHSKDVLWRSPTCPSLAVSSHQPLRPVHGGGNPMNIMLYIIYVYYII